MKTIKLVVVGLLLAFSSCSESDSEVCNEECYEIIGVENGSRNCYLSGPTIKCVYNFKVTFKNQCSGYLEYKTTNYRPLDQKPKVGEIKCSFFGYR